jgi:predicted aminopeptidase
MRTKLLVALLPFLGSCANLGYYWQSVSGQMELWKKEQPIEILLADQNTAPKLKQKLRRVLEIREFASHALGLPDNGSYRQYADLQRPFVVWNVFAVPEFSINPQEWCFLIIGCVSYRGYFSESAAQEFAVSLSRAGYDVFVVGVPAYSTLGWFDDPVLSTFLHYSETEIARLIFHELAHQLLYVPDDSTFNESFATAVEEAGVDRWLEENGNDRLRPAFADAQRRKKDFVALVLRYRERLQGFYASDASDRQKRAGKAKILRELQEEYAALKIKWQGFNAYDRWFAQNLNNAHLASVAAYTQMVPAFQLLLAQQHGNLLAFYGVVREIARLPRPERVARLASAGSQ